MQHPDAAPSIKVTTPKPALRVPPVGWLSLAALVAEYFVLSQRYDITILGGHDRPWSFLGHVGDGAAMIFIALAVAIALLRRTRSMLSGSAENKPRPTLWHWLEFGLGFGCFGLGLMGSNSVLREQPPTALQFLVWSLSLCAWLFCRTHWTWPVGGVRTVLAQWRIWGPIAAIALLSAAAGLGARTLWEYQSDVVLEWVVGLLRAVGESPERGPGSEIWLEDFGVDIAPVCSGYEGIGLMVAFLGGYLVVMRKQLDPRRAWPLLPLAVVVVWFANVGRLATLTWIGARVSAEWAAGAFHSKAGWLLFCGIALGAVGLTQRVARREPEPPSAPPSSKRAAERRSSPKPAATTGTFDATDLPPSAPLGQATTYYLAPLVAATATALLTGLFFEPLDRLYGLRAAVSLAVLVAVGYRFRGLATGFNVYSVGVGLIAFVVWWGLSAAPDADAIDRFAEQFEALAPLEQRVWVILRVLGSVITVPICEELAFRGFVLRRIASRDFVALHYRDVGWLPIAASSVLFAVLHGSWLAGAAVGLIYAGLVRRRGKLAEVTVAHMATNLCVAVQALSSNPVPYWN